MRDHVHCRAEQNSPLPDSLLGLGFVSPYPSFHVPPPSPTPSLPPSSSKDFPPSIFSSALLSPPDFFNPSPLPMLPPQTPSLTSHNPAPLPPPSTSTAQFISLPLQQYKTPVPPPSPLSVPPAPSVTLCRMYSTPVPLPSPLSVPSARPCQEAPSSHQLPAAPSSLSSLARSSSLPAGLQQQHSPKPVDRCGYLFRWS
ncbi:unnamed protein product [Closterium sp. Naga37s-1]|nr:unnamed protein product [Closterium sp. Naga37s-1]